MQHYWRWASAIIARTSAIALALRSLRDEWIIALSGYFNIPARKQSGFYPHDTFDSAFRQNFDKISPGA